MVREQEAGLETAEVLPQARGLGGDLDAWKAGFGGLGVTGAKRPKALAGESAELKRSLAEAMLDNAVPKDLAARKS